MGEEEEGQESEEKEGEEDEKDEEDNEDIDEEQKEKEKCKTWCHRIGSLRAKSLRLSPIGPESPQPSCSSMEDTHSPGLGSIMCHILDLQYMGGRGVCSSR